MEKIEIGKIVAAHGIRGEVRILNWSEDPDRFSTLERVYLSGSEEPFRIEKARPNGTLSIVKFEGIVTRNDAEALRGRTVCITEEDLPALPEDVYFVKDLMGLTVLDDDTGETVGTLAEVIQNTAQDIYRIERKGAGDVLVPVVEEFVKEVDLAAGTVRIHFIEGMKD